MILQPLLTNGNVFFYALYNFCQLTFNETKYCWDFMFSLIYGSHPIDSFIVASDVVQYVHSFLACFMLVL